MRMWNIKPEIMCRQHLLGEHFEIHKMIGNLKNSGTWAFALTRNGFLEPQNAVERHNMLVLEMGRRGFNHNSPLNVSGVKLPRGKVNMKKSMHDLFQRCEVCRGRGK